MTWTEESDSQVLTIRLSGEIDLQHSPKLRALLQTKVSLKSPVLLLDFTEVKYIDSSGLATLVEYYKNSRSYSGRLAVAGLSNRVRSIFDLVRLSEVFGIFPTISAAREAFCWPLPGSDRLSSYLQLNFRILYWLFAGPLQKQSFKLAHVFQQMIRIGVEAIPMASLTSFSIGLTLAMQASHELTKMGADIYVPNLVAVSLLRELGPLLIGVIVIGRSGSAVTAELGTMRVSEEIEALDVMAINPVRFLVVPRFLAMMFMLPVLTVFGNYVGMLGGWAICYFALDMTTAGYIMRCIEAAQLGDLYSGLCKSVVFAWLIVTIACHSGLKVEGGAEGVGIATTRSVVHSLLAILIANAMMTALFFFL